MKKKLVWIMIVAVLGTTLCACSQTEKKAETNNSESTQAEESETESENALAESSENEEGNTPQESDTDIEGTLVIWDWNGDAQLEYIKKFNDVYPNITIEVQDVSWDDYMTKLQTSYVAGMELPDIIFGEIAWRGTLFEMGICENLEQEPYNLNRDLMVASSVPLVSDSNGNIVGLEMQVTPAGFAYKRDLATEYLGTDNPEEIAAMISDWDDFLAVGKEVLEKSDGKVKMMPSLGDVLLSTLSQNVVDFVDGNTVDVTKKMTDPLNTTIKLRDAEIIGNVEMYSANWYAAYASNEYLFYEAAAWCPPYVITVNDPDGSGNWGITTPPGGSFNLGGTSLSINKDSENKEAAWAFLEYVYFSEEGGSLMYEISGNYSSYQPYYEGDYSPFGEKGPYDEFFGGQSLVSFYIEEAAPQAKTATQTKYDAIVNDVFQKLTPKYMEDLTITTETALELFKEEVALKDIDAEIK